MRTLFFTTAILLTACDTGLKGDALCANEGSTNLVKQILTKAMEAQGEELGSLTIKSPAEVKSESVEGKTMCRAEFIFPEETVWARYSVEIHGKNQLFVAVIGE